MFLTMNGFGFHPSTSLIPTKGVGIRCAQGDAWGVGRKLSLHHADCKPGQEAFHPSLWNCTAVGGGRPSTALFVSDYEQWQGLQFRKFSFGADQ
jgi:hypothetical protein